MITHYEAKRIANEHFRSRGARLVASHAHRDREYGVWIVDYSDPDYPAERLDGGALVVTDDGEVHSMGSTPDSLDKLMMERGRISHLGFRPTGADAEAILRLADENPEEAKELTARAAAALNPWPGVLEPPREILKAVYGDQGEVYPDQDDVFAAFHQTPFDEVKVVILGQDPYPNPEDATGLAFAVRPGRRLPTSLANIHRALEAEGITPPEDLTEWAKQGVLLLNTALTVPRRRAGGHLKLWRPFTEQVIQALNGREKPVVWVLWGRKAQRWAKVLDPDTVVTARHPAARGAHRVEFINSKTFSRVNQKLAGLGQPPIECWPKGPSSEADSAAQSSGPSLGPASPGG